MRLIPLVALPALLIASLISPAAHASPAADAVTAFHAKLLTVMKEGPKLGVKGRYDALAPAIDKTFHLALTARQAAGRTAWKMSSDGVRKAYVDAFRNWTITTYASEFKAFSGQKFTTLGEEPGPQPGTALVKTQLDDPGGEPVTLTYLMIDQGGSWGVYDVMVKRGSTAISQLAKYISEFRTLAQGGLSNLTAALNEKSKQLMAP